MKHLGHIIAINNQKGGVGKTTSVVNLGKNIAEKGYKVALIDIDPQSDLTTAIYPADELPEGVEIETPEGLRPGMKNSYIFFKGENMPVADTIVFGADVGIDIFPTTSQLANLEKDGFEVISTFQEKVRTLAEDYDFILIDTPPGMGNLQTAALAAATKVLIPTTLETFSIKNLNKLIAMIGNLKKTGNPEVEILGIFATASKAQKTKLMNHYLGELAEDFPGMIFKSEITSSTDVATALALGMSINEYKPKAKQAKQFKDLTKEILEGVGV